MNNYYGYIYKITNNINNKIYIGQKKSDVVLENYWGSGTLIKKAISKYGVGAFTRDILEWCDDAETLNSRENYWIEYYDARHIDKGYNLAVGGTVIGMKHSAETIEKIRQSNKGQKRSEECRRNISTAHKGKKLSEEHKQKISNYSKSFYAMEECRKGIIR